MGRSGWHCSLAGGWWLVAGGWWLVAGGWWLVAGGWIGTCRLNDVDPESYLRHGLES
ncbi:transposase domain-containing protein [Escherichia coli]|nr:transposase domain-containing protein [Escherichia coli]EHT3512218.1 transposase domain-containing protein [Escherichia coli]EIJ9635417.1 transposase domain-containing protein [Escherichia coli]EIP7903252.1 transposase domain-containing protein [Escherichia coli]EIQ4348689.1 transposase domain-containing protein [Escherichia coli]EIS6217562.1 transposase domain-containing protein [Escherichia coli]